MMRISIAQRLRPYSTDAGEGCPLPKSPFALRVYPSRLQLFSLDEWSSKPTEEIEIPTKGIVKGFTTSLDLEHGDLSAWGYNPEGYFRHKISTSETGNILYSSERPLKANITELPSAIPQQVSYPSERVSLGCHRAQEWNSIRQRAQLAEWLPLWHRLGQWWKMPLRIENDWLYEESLFGHCARAIVRQNTDEIEKNLQKLYQLTFRDFFFPCPELAKLMGSSLPATQRLSPLELLRCGSLLIKSLFLMPTEGCFLILPALPHTLHSGRYLNAPLNDGSTIDFEWSKHLLRRAVIRATNSGSVRLSWPKILKRSRLRSNLSISSQICFNGDEIALEQGGEYYLDRFEK